MHTKGHEIYDVCSMYPNVIDVKLIKKAKRKMMLNFWKREKKNANVEVTSLSNHNTLVDAMERLNHSIGKLNDTIEEMRLHKWKDHV